MCHISSSLASSIITNHATPSSLNEPNSLEMLQKTAEDVLDSASQGLLSGNLIDELAFRKNKSDGDDKADAYKHRCRYCSKIFGSDSALQIHLRSHTGERPFKCNVCGSRFTTRGNLKVHFQRHTQIYPHLQMNSNPMPEHMDTHKSSIYASLSPPPPPPPTFAYGSTKPLINRQQMYRPPSEYHKLVMSEDRHSISGHNNADINKEKRVSNDCTEPRRADEKSSYRHHTNRAPLSDDDEKPIAIRRQPNRATKEMTTTYEHAGTSNNEQSWKQFIKTSETSKLQKLVDNIEHKLTDPNECMICHRILQSRTALEIHYKMHSDGCTEKPSAYQCKICERTFGTKGNLKAHMSIHDEQRPPSFDVHPKCPVCHKQYINLLVLQQHIREHTGEPTEMTIEQIRAGEIRESDKFKTATIDVDDDYNEEELLEDEAYNNRMNHYTMDNISNSDSDDSHELMTNRKSEPSTTERECIAAKSSVTPLSQHTTSGSESVAQMEQSSPTPSEMSQSSALDLRPRQQFSYSPSSSSINGGPSPHHPHPPMGLFPNFPFHLGQHPAHSSHTPLQYNAALNSLAHSVMPSGSFNPLGFPGKCGQFFAQPFITFCYI